MKIIAIANQKGGVGKTTTAVNMVSILNKKGKKALLIDTDQQCNATDTFRAQYEGVATLYDCWLEEPKSRKSIMECIQKTEIGSIVAGDPLLSEAESKISKDPMAGLLSFKNMLSNLEGYEYVIVDCPPTRGAAIQSILVAADEVIIPVSSDRYSIQGLSQIWETIGNIRAGINPKLKIAGLLLVKHNQRTNLNKGGEAALASIAEQLDTKIFKTFIRESTAARESLAARETLLTYKPGSTSGEDYQNFVKEYLKGEK